MKRYWTIKGGKEIEYKDLGDSHLINILHYIKKKSDEGLTLMSGGGFDSEEIWYDEYTLFGEEVLEHFDYKYLLKEAKRRGLKP